MNHIKPTFTAVPPPAMTPEEFVLRASTNAMNALEENGKLRRGLNNTQKVVGVLKIVVTVLAGVVIALVVRVGQLV